MRSRHPCALAFANSQHLFDCVIHHWLPTITHSPVHVHAAHSQVNDRLHVCLQIGAASGKWTHKQLAVTVNAMQLQQRLGHPQLASAQAAQEHAHKCAALYAEWLPLIKSLNLAPTDLGVGEDVITLAVDALMVAHDKRRDLRFVIEVRACLPPAVRKSASSLNTWYGFLILSPCVSGAIG